MTALILPPPWLPPYSDNELAEAAMLLHHHDVRPRLSDTLLHALADDPTFEVRDTMPCDPPSSGAPTLRAPAAPSSAPAVAADEWNDGWLP